MTGKHPRQLKKLLNYVTSFEPDALLVVLPEIVVHDLSFCVLFMTSAIQDCPDIADFSNPADITLIKSVDMRPYGGITSVAGVAVASPAPPREQDNGSVVF